MFHSSTGLFRYYSPIYFFLVRNQTSAFAITKIFLHTRCDYRNIWLDCISIFVCDRKPNLLRPSQNLICVCRSKSLLKLPHHYLDGQSILYKIPIKIVYWFAYKIKFTTRRHCDYSYADNTIGHSKIKNINYICNNERSYFAIDICTWPSI